MVLNVDNQNPYAAPASIPERLLPDRRIRPGWLRGLIILQVLVIIASLVAEAFQHTSILFSGPVFSLVGGVIAVVALRSEDRPATMFGGSAIAFSFMIVFLINYNSWGPAQGDRPITALCLLYSAVVLPSAGWLVLARGSSDG